MRKSGFGMRAGVTALAAVFAMHGQVLAASRAQPVDVDPDAAATPAPMPTGAAPMPTGSATVAPPVLPSTPVIQQALAWRLADAQALLGVIDAIGAEGLIPADYQPDALRAAIAGGEGEVLNRAAAQSFTWLAEDLRDGRTPVSARLQWFAVDTDRDTNPTDALMARALESGDVVGVLADLAPTYPGYAALKAELAATPESEEAVRALIRANMDRWRWLNRDLGTLFLITNVPEFQLRLATNHRIVRTYRTVVGKPGRTATPQLAETVTAVVFNPTWTVPQSIVKGEGLGARLLANPASARAQGYRVTRRADGFVTVVQQPGDNNSLGRMKIDMPNPHAIYLHDTPSKALFNTPVRAYSHGCIRTERAVELGMTLAIMGAGMTPEEAAATSTSGKYTKVAMKRTVPVYITYFTMGQDIDGQMRRFADIYGRDAAVLASFEKPREPKTDQRISDEPIIELDNPL